MPKYSPNDEVCITCTHIVYEAKSVNCISYSGGDWVFLCGDKEHYSYDADEEKLLVVHHRHLTDIDKSLIEIIQLLEIDYTAERKDKDSEWVIYYDPDED